MFFSLPAGLFALRLTYSKVIRKWQSFSSLFFTRYCTSQFGMTFWKSDRSLRLLVLNAAFLFISQRQEYGKE